METELESLAPRHAPVLTTTGTSITWSAFIVGQKGVKRIVLGDHGIVRVHFESGLVVPLIGLTDAWAVEKRAEPVKVAAPVQKQAGRR